TLVSVSRSRTVDGYDSESHHRNVTYKRIKCARGSACSRMSCSTKAPLLSLDRGIERGARWLAALGDLALPRRLIVSGESLFVKSMNESLEHHRPADWL